ncbi:M18 family aminopeptidase [Tessaracoccus sp. OS52]|uniref:M18 family aminopeptidase n=1 Tax=Tessaracoccus sp. OS52 TaxID=2886691 RepID=UPI001D11E6AD|nr:M18 family aminopeptidase [Tessaracoccus sp. OS52]MCC2593546.1 M18 family aminopeptidase [Tessaracoccus sp. OS52]
MLSDAASHLDDLASYVVASPTSYHAAATAAERLEAVGFLRVDEKRAFPKVGGKYFVVRHGAVVAWLQPNDLGADAGFRIVGTHTDSPAFKVKPGELLTSAGWSQVGVEVYGGMLLNSWLDRELGIAGRIVTRDGAQHLLRTGPIARVPQLAIHLDRGVNDGLKLDKQGHTQPVIALAPKGGLLLHLCELAGVRPADVALHDLYLFDVALPARFGLHDEFFASGRLDNLSSTHAALAAMEAAQPGDDVAVFVAFDHEEVGSATSSGAAGPILEDVLVRIASAAGLDVDGTRAMLARSSCISADTGHVVHPNYPNHHDPVVRPLPNKGPLVKLNANQRYATDAVGGAIWLEACDRAEVPTQPFVSNNAVPCGSTIGPITATRLGITTVDVGIGLLSMHSAREMCGAEDPHHLARAIAAYWA